MTDQTLPAAGGSYIREADGTLRRVEEEAAPAPAAEAVEAPVQAPVKTAFKSTRKEAL